MMIKLINIFKIVLLVGSLVGAGKSIHDFTSPKMFSKDIYLDKNYKTQNDPKIKFCFHNTKRIKDIVFPNSISAISLIEINGIKILKNQNDSLFKFANNRYSFIDDFEIRTGNENGITFTISPYNEKRKIVNSTIFYTVDDEVLKKEFNNSYVYWSVLLLLIAGLLHWYELKQKNKVKLEYAAPPDTNIIEELKETNKNLRKEKDAIIEEFEKFKTDDPRDFKKAETILGKVKAKLEKQNVLTVLSMDSFSSEEKNSIPLGIFVIWIVISRIYLEETGIPSVATTENYYSKIDIIRSLNGDFEKILEKHASFCHKEGHDKCNLYEMLLLNDFAKINKEIINESFAKCPKFCYLFKEIATLSNFGTPSLMHNNPLYDDISKLLAESVKIANNNFDSIIKGSAYEKIFPIRSSWSKVKELPHKHLFAKIIIGSETDFQNPHVESMILFYELFNIPLFFIDKLKIEEYLKDNPNYWYKSLKDDLLIINDELKQGYTDDNSWPRVTKEHLNFFDMIKNNSLSVMFAYDRLILNQYKKNNLNDEKEKAIKK